MDNATLITRRLRHRSDDHRSAGSLDVAYELKCECPEPSRKLGANVRDGDHDLGEMCNIRLKQRRPADALMLGLDLWAEIQKRPESGEEIAHRGEVAESLLNCYTALKAAQPNTPPPIEAADWQSSIEQRKQLNLTPK